MTFLKRLALASRWSYPRIPQFFTRTWRQQRKLYRMIGYYAEYAWEGFWKGLLMLLVLAWVPIQPFFALLAYLFNPFFIVVLRWSPERWTEVEEAMLKDMNKSKTPDNDT